MGICSFQSQFLRPKITKKTKVEKDSHTYIKGNTIFVYLALDDPEGLSKLHLIRKYIMCILVKYREERTEKCKSGFILILTNTKSGLFWADEAAYNNQPNFRSSQIYFYPQKYSFSLIKVLVFILTPLRMVVRTLPTQI